MSTKTLSPSLEEIFGGLSEKRFKLLFLVLCIVFFGVPVIGDVFIVHNPWAAKLIYLAMVASLLLAASSIAKNNRRAYFFIIAFNFVGVGLNVLFLFQYHEIFLLLNHIVISTVLAYVIISLTRYLITCSVVTSYTIYAALSAFLLIALLWAFLYGIVDMVEPGAFRMPADISSEGRIANLGSIRSFHGLYFSLVTITTLGYGDISPITVKARMLCSAEAFVGQMFMAVMVARLVGIYSSQSAQGGEK